MDNFLYRDLEARTRFSFLCSIRVTFPSVKFYVKPVETVSNPLLDVAGPPEATVDQGEERCSPEGSHPTVSSSQPQTKTNQTKKLYHSYKVEFHLFNPMNDQGNGINSF